MDGTIRLRTVASFAAAVFIGFAAAIVMLWAIRADAAPGDSDTTFVPIAPCRLADTRPAPNRVGTIDTFGGDQTQTFTAHGSNGECANIPSDAVGLSLNVTAVGASLPTYLTIWGSGTMPLVSSLNPTPGQPPTPNAVTTPLSAGGGFNVYNLQGAVDVIIDVNGFYTEQSLAGLDSRVATLEAAGVSQAVLDRLDALEAENAALKAKTASMSVLIDNGQPTVRFTGVNVQVVSGSGATNGVINGRGNLIVGYNEASDWGDTKTGSHNVIIGANHTYSNYGGLVAGFDHVVTGLYASVSGGNGNSATGDFASVSGGSSNGASGAYASVSGGQLNEASGDSASVSGGTDGEAAGAWSSVSGGSGNLAFGFSASVSGGSGGQATGVHSSISGGSAGTASGRTASVSGGSLGIASGSSASVSGGHDNEATASFASASGGENNIASGEHSSVSGGKNNVATGGHSSVTGGISNEANATNSSVTGGADNVADGLSSSVSGGYGRTASGTDDWRAGSLLENF